MCGGACAAGGGKGRPGFQAVKQVVLGCIPDADGLRYDPDMKEIVLSIGGHEQPFYNLSAGQRMMLALTADIAIKAVTLNSYLFAPGKSEAEEPERLMKATPGVVLIDELDVHLHPRWQRRVASDLKRSFPEIQFVCTSHSPQIIGEIMPDEIRMLRDEAVFVPVRSFGIDSSRILEDLMDAKPRNETIDKLLNQLSRLIDEEKFSEAKALLKEAEGKLGPEDPEITRATTLMSFLETEL
jgi:predicted ATP-binding protein involved in virulence